MKGTLYGLNVDGSCDTCVDDIGREMEVMRPWLERDDRAERTDSRGRRVGRRGFGVGVSMGI